MNLFSFLGRHFWLVCLAITAINYAKGLRSLSSQAPPGRTIIGSKPLALRGWRMGRSGLCGVTSIKGFFSTLRSGG